MNKIKSSLLFVSLVLFTSCSSVPMDDFFGIEMTPESENHFNIVSYSQENGVQYTSDFTMNPNVYAYAELRVDEVWIKVVNKSDKPIKSNYNQDEFYLYDSLGNVFALRKGDRHDYPEGNEIPPGGSRQFKLYYWDPYGWDPYAGSQSYDRYSFTIWGDKNNSSFNKKAVKKIKVVLGGKTTLILKPLPAKD